MGFNTKTNFTTQVKQYSGTTALLSGSTQMLEGLTANTLTTLDGMAYYTGSNTDISDIDSAIPKVLVTKEWVENEISIVNSADTFISAVTFDNMTYDLTLHRNDAVDMTTSLAGLASDIYVISGAYDPNTGNVVFTNNSGNTFSVSGFTTGMTNYYTTGVSLNNTTLAFNRNDTLSAYTINLNTLFTGSTLSASTPYEFTTGTTDGSIQPSYSTLMSNLNTSAWSTIGGGTGNTINKPGSSFSFIGAGSNNTLVGSNYSFIGSGKANLINTPNVDSDFNFIGGGNSNSITGGTTSHGFIGGGFSNNLGYYGRHSSIVGGYNNRIKGDYYAFIGGGYNNFIHYGYGQNNTILNGKNNTIYDSWNSFILGGRLNTITTSRQVGLYVTPLNWGGTIVNGRDNSIHRGHGAFIGQGSGNTISIIGNVAYSYYNTILNGQGNKIIDPDNNTGFKHNMIGGGVINIISKGNGNTIINGVLNYINTDYITLTNSNSIIDGYRNRIDGSSSFSNTIINGGVIGLSLSGNTISQSLDSLIGNGVNNKIVSNSITSSILNGTNNLISGLTNTHVIGSNITATTSNTTFVNKLNLYDAPTTANSVSEILVRDTDGTVKVRNASTISSVSPFSTGTTSTSIYPTASVGNSVIALNSTIAGGSGNTISTPLSFIGGAQDSIISGTSSSSIIGGKNNTIQHSATGNTSHYSFIGGGFNNNINISDSTYTSFSNIILGGMNSTISGYGYLSTIINGDTCTITNSGYGFIGAGQLNSVLSTVPTWNNGILLGNTNTITGNTSYNTILNGSSNIIEKNAYSNIGGGSVNKIINTETNSYVKFNTIGSGRLNLISGTTIGSYRFLSNTIHNGYQNKINNVSGTWSNYNTILNGVFNEITVYGSYNLINGNQNKITGITNTYNNVIFGNNNKIFGDSDYNHIFGRNSNIIGDGAYRTIIGTYNQISGLTNTHIIGSNITATTSNFTYVNNLNLYDTPTTGSTTGDTVNNILYRNSNGDVRMVDISTAFNREISLALSDEVTDLVTGTTVVTRRSPYNLELTTARIEVNTPPSGASVTVDVKVNGVSIFSTLISIDSGEETSVTSATPYVITGSTINYNDKITADITTVGTTTAGKGLKMDLFGTLF